MEKGHIQNHPARPLETWRASPRFRDVCRDDNPSRCDSTPAEVENTGRSFRENQKPNWLQNGGATSSDFVVLLMCMGMIHDDTCIIYIYIIIYTYIHI